jgi:MFS superfamily sulfate permease-like transporter
MNGIALTVLASQLPALFGVSVQGEGPAGEEPEADGWPWSTGKANLTALMLGIGSTLAVIWLLKRSKRLPGILLAVIGNNRDGGCI